MLYWGATVVSVEPQRDLAAAINASVELNCWSDRAIVINARACFCTGCRRARSWRAYREAHDACMRPSGVEPPPGPWRQGGGYWGKALAGVGGVSLDDVLFAGLQQRGAQTTPHIELIKADGDGPEGGWLHSILELLEGGYLSLTAMVLEGNHIAPSTLLGFQVCAGSA